MKYDFQCVPKFAFAVAVGFEERKFFGKKVRRAAKLEWLVKTGLHIQPGLFGEHPENQHHRCVFALGDAGECNWIVFRDLREECVALEVQLCRRKDFCEEIPPLRKRGFGPGHDEHLPGKTARRTQQKIPFWGKKK